VCSTCNTKNESLSEVDMKLDSPIHSSAEGFNVMLLLPATTNS